MPCNDGYYGDGNMGGWLSSAVSSVKKGVSKLAKETKRAAKDSWSRAKTAGKAYVLSGGNPVAAGAAVVGEELMSREEEKALKEQKKMEKAYKKEEKQMRKEQALYDQQVVAAVAVRQPPPPKPKKLSMAQIRSRLMFFQNLAKFMLLLRSNPDRLNNYYNSMAAAIKKEKNPAKRATLQKIVMGVRSWIKKNPAPKIPMSTDQVEESLGLAATIMMRFKMDPVFAKTSLQQMRFENRNNPEALLKINDFVFKLNDFKPTPQDVEDWNQLQQEGGIVAKGGMLPVIAAVGIGAAMLLG